MGVKITTPMETDKGSSSSVYVNVKEFHVTKGLRGNIVIGVYKDKASRDADENDTVKTFKLKPSYQVTMDDFNFSPGKMYTKLKEALAADSLLNEDLD